MTAPVNNNDQSRPKYLNLFQIRLPVTGLVSIGHRVTGALLFVGSPFALYLLDRSMRSPEDFERLRVLLTSLPVKLGMLLLVAVAGYHLIAGIRFLLIDWGVGEELANARRGAWSVLVLSAVFLLAALVVML